MVGATLDVASLEAAPPDLRGAVAQVLLGVLEDGSSYGLVSLDVTASVGRSQCHRQGVDKKGGEPHGELVRIVEGG